MITIAKDKEKSSTYTIKLYFAELEDRSADSRFFDVHVQGDQVLKNYNVPKDAGGTNRITTKVIEGVSIKDTLTNKLSFKSPDILPLLSGVEVIASKRRLGSVE